MMHRIIVIGAGIGGLTAAAWLTRAGADVTVLEAHVYPGGCAGTFFHQGYRTVCARWRPADRPTDSPAPVCGWAAPDCGPGCPRGMASWPAPAPCIPAQAPWAVETNKGRSFAATVIFNLPPPPAA
ncbi:MAG: FAD-dependent oxidoreductase [Anaerolineae bacterium]|nr:FAD-dependent oxidoreductase [Anaerolineae bacterium]